MNNKEKGLYQKYEVKKLSNPEKKVDAIVLEFDDKISRVGIKAFAHECRVQGFVQLANDLDDKLAVSAVVNAIKKGPEFA